MSDYKVKIHKEALFDIQEATDWYNKISNDLGTRFQIQVKQQINVLKTNALHNSIRYSDVRCSLIRKFPFLIHYTVDEEYKIAEVFAVIHTSRNPKIWEVRRSLF